jgi:hypothetical protein|tara:strand:+ start:121 stop:315 length:195 start_codon:yes stop_codon:yes gene_type:complete
MGESINKIIKKTDDVIMSCENYTQLMVAKQYADLAIKFYQDHKDISRLKEASKQTLAAKGVMLK